MMQISTDFLLSHELIEIPFMLKQSIQTVHKSRRFQFFINSDGNDGSIRRCLTLSIHSLCLRSKQFD